MESKKHDSFRFLKWDKHFEKNNKFLYTDNLIKLKKNDYGVLEQSSMIDVENYLLEGYDIFKKI